MLGFEGKLVGADVVCGHGLDLDAVEGLKGLADLHLHVFIR